MSPTVEFGSKVAADAWREEHPEHIAPSDDARLKTVTFNSEIPEALLERAHLEGDEGRAEREAGPGQAELTDHEREQLDFSKGRANVLHARSVKAIALDEGVDDWVAHYDPTLTVDEHREVMERATIEDRGQRLDAEDTASERAGRAAASAQADECDHARGHCRMGDPGACEFLRVACGLTDEEIGELLAAADDVADEDGEPPTDVEQLPGEIRGALQRSWQGYQGAVTDLEHALDDLDTNWQHAQQAARAINGIRERMGQGPLHFERLEDLQGELADIVRAAAADCHECHLRHRGHGHVGPAAESLRELLGDPGEATDADVTEALEGSA